MHVSIMLIANSQQVPRHTQNENSHFEKFEITTYGSAMLFHCLLSKYAQFIAIEGCGTWIILLLCIGCNAIVLPKELCRICISAQLHLPQLNPRPIRVQICWSHKCQMDAQISMNCWAINANKYTIRHRRPRRILCIAIKTCLQLKKKKKQAR